MSHGRRSEDRTTRVPRPPSPRHAYTRCHARGRRLGLYMTRPGALGDSHSPAVAVPPSPLLSFAVSSSHAWPSASQATARRRTASAAAIFMKTRLTSFTRPNTRFRRTYGCPGREGSTRAACRCRRYPPHASRITATGGAAAHGRRRAPAHGASPRRRSRPKPEPSSRRARSPPWLRRSRPRCTRRWTSSSASSSTRSPRRWSGAPPLSPISASSALRAAPRGGVRGRGVRPRAVVAVLALVPWWPSSSSCRGGAQWVPPRMPCSSSACSWSFGMWFTGHVGEAEAPACVLSPVCILSSSASCCSRSWAP
ncbi:hypothetical protein VPH35_129102 [Triticum aestivum]